MNNLQKIARHMARPERQSGQAIVLIAMLMVVLMASLGLAIDGGGMYLLWRDAQNAADAAAIQAAYSYCTAQNDRVNVATVAGITGINENSFKDSALPALADDEVDWSDAQKLAVAGPIDDPGTAEDEFLNSNAMFDAIVGQATSLGYTAAELPSNASNINNIILVEVRAKKPAFFIQLVYGGPLSVTATALGACSPGGDSPYAGYAVFTTATYADDCTQPRYNNSGSYTYYGSPIYANTDLDLTGNTTEFADGTGAVYGGSLQDPNNAGDDAPIEDFGEPVESFPPLFTFEQFVDGTGFAATITALGTSTWTGESYYHYVDGNYQLKKKVEGVYVVTGDITSGSGANKPDIGPNGITLISQGQIDGGGGSINNGETGWQPFGLGDTDAQYILMFTDWDGGCNAGAGTSGIEFGGSNVFGRGLLYAPNSHIHFSASNTVWCGALISKTSAPSGSKKWFFSNKMPSAAELAAFDPAVPDFVVNFADANCNYLPDPEPGNFFLGDVNG